MNHTERFLGLVAGAIERLDAKAIDDMTDSLVRLRQRGGRLFIVGNGGGAGHASHAAADFRTLAGIEAYSVSDNASSVTALVNDCGWKDAYALWLQQSHLSVDDGLLVISVGGGDDQRNISPNIINAVMLAEEVGAGIYGIAGRDGGYTAKVATACVVIPTVADDLVTPIVEGLQSVILHLLVSDQRLAIRKAKWEASV